MKKIISILIALIMCMSAVAASAAEAPAFLYDTPLNYSMKMETSLEFSDPDSIINLLKKYEVYDEISNYIDVKGFLSSATIEKQEILCDISEDLNSISLGLKQTLDSKMIVNRNFNAQFNLSQEAYIKADIAKQELNIIFTQIPFNKYVVIDIADLLSEEDYKQVFDILKTVLNKHYINDVTKKMADLIAKNSKITKSGNKYTISINNDDFKGFIKDIILYIEETIEAVTKEELEDTEDILNAINEINFLGKNGIKAEYTLSGGKVSALKSTADISISLSEKLCEEISFDPDFKLDFAVKSTSSYSAYGKTTVKYPVLNEENSIDFLELYPERSPDYEYEYDYDYEYEVTYPNYWVECSCEASPVLNGEYYIPLRAIMENAYEDAIDIGYENGYITLKSEYFKDYSEIKLAVGSDIVYTDNTEIKISPVYEYNDTTYISTAAITEIFGWELTTLNHDILENMYYFSFITE